MPRLKIFTQFLGSIYYEVMATRCTRMAASLSYSTLLSLVPLLIIVFWVLSFFSVFHGLGDVMQQFIISTFVADLANTLSGQLSAFVSQLQVLRWTHLLSLFVVTVLMMYNMVTAFGHIWQVKMRRSLALSFLVYVLILLISPIIFGLLLLLGPYIASLHIIANQSFQGLLHTPLLVVLPYVVAWVVFTFFNWIVPATRVKFKCALVAGFVTMWLFECARYVFSLYITYVSSYRIIYGALAVIPFFLIWMYLTWLLILIGVVLCHRLQQVWESA